MKNAPRQHATQHFVHASRKRNTVVRRAIMEPAQTAHPVARVARRLVVGMVRQPQAVGIQQNATFRLAHLSANLPAVAHTHQIVITAISDLFL